MSNLNSTLNNLYKIGQVSRRSGVQVATLRAWDKRKQLVAETRVGSIRYYTKEQVDRATWFQKLIKCGLGYTIGTLVPKTNEELQKLVEEIEVKPFVQARATVEHIHSRDIAIVIGWQLYAMRAEYLKVYGESESEGTQIQDLGLYTIDLLAEYLKGVDAESIAVAVIYLPHVWNVNETLDQLRVMFDSYDQSDCQIIAISPNSLETRFEQEQQAASSKGIKLIRSNHEGVELTWANILAEVNEAREFAKDAPTTQNADIARLCYLLSVENRTVAGIHTADFVAAYEQIQNLIGSVNRASQSLEGMLDTTATHLQTTLTTVISELEPWLSELAELPESANS